MYSAYKLNQQGDNIQPWRTPFPIGNQFVVPCLVLTLASWPAYRFLKRWVRWSGIPISFRIFHSLLWSTQSRLWHSQESKNTCFSGTLLLFQWLSGCWQFDLWFLCLFLNQLEHLEVHGSRIAEARLGKFWALLYWHVRWVQLCGSLSILWDCLSLGLEWKRTFSSPVATAEFSKFAGKLNVALSQHHLSGFEIAQLEFHHLH